VKRQRGERSTYTGVERPACSTCSTPNGLWAV